MYKTILVPLDGSRRAEKILPHVEALAGQEKSKVILMQIIEPASAEFVPGLNTMVTPQELEIYWTSLKAAEERAKEYLQSKAADFEKKKIPAETILQRGDAVNGIVSVAKEKNADLIAMASHGRTGLSRVFYGSVANGVLHKVDRPLLLIRAED
ncbi:MAG: universal stress protein [Anaerolineales bacterium]